MRAIGQGGELRLDSLTPGGEPVRHFFSPPYTTAHAETAPQLPARRRRAPHRRLPRPPIMQPPVSKWTWVLLSVLLCLVARPGLAKKAWRCPSTCSCSRESIICVGSPFVPRISPNDITSL